MNKEESSLQIIRDALKKHPELRVSDSGGIDSVVVSHLAKRCGVERGVFFNTGVEEKTNLKFMKEKKRAGEDIEWLTPNMSFKQSCYEYGFPIGGKEVARQVAEIQNISKNLTPKNMSLFYKRLTGFNGLGLTVPPHIKRSKFAIPMWGFEAIIYNVPITSKCCHILKKSLIPKAGYTLTGEMAVESDLRAGAIKSKGVIGKRKALPLHDWTKVDVWEYVRKYNLSYSDHYKGEDELNPTIRSGCTHCYTRLQYEDTTLKVQEKYPKQHALIMKYPHKDGMLFSEAVAIMKRIFSKPNRLLQHMGRIDMILLFKGIAKRYNVEYNNEPLDFLMAHSENQVQRLLK